MSFIPVQQKALSWNDLTNKRILHCNTRSVSLHIKSHTSTRRLFFMKLIYKEITRYSCIIKHGSGRNQANCIREKRCWGEVV